MLFLLFHIGKDRYALEARRVVEVLPLLELKEVPQAPPGLAGLINYRGEPVPVVDVTLLAVGRRSSEKFSTRIIVVRCESLEGSPHLLGLIAEQATETLSRKPHEFLSTGLGNVERPYLGPVLMDPAGPIQWIHEDRLLTSNVRKSVLDLASPPAA